MQARSRKTVDKSRAAPAIGPARPDDVADLLALENAAFAGDRLTRRSLARLVRAPTARVIVARAGTALAGYVILLLHARRRAGRLYSVAVADGFAGRGYGRALIEAACAAAGAAGRKAVTLEVRADNRRAIELYRRIGFVDTSTIENYYEDGETALRMSRRLDPAGGTRP